MSNSKFFLLWFVFFSGPSRPVEVALEHQPAAAEPSTADEGGRWRSRQGQWAQGTLLWADDTLSVVFISMRSRRPQVHSKLEQNLTV